MICNLNCSNNENLPAGNCKFWNIGAWFILKNKIPEEKCEQYLTWRRKVFWKGKDRTDRITAGGKKNQNGISVRDATFQIKMKDKFQKFRKMQVTTDVQNRTSESGVQIWKDYLFRSLSIP